MQCVDLQCQISNAFEHAAQYLTACVGATGCTQPNLRAAASYPRCITLAMSIPHGDKSIIFIRT